MPVCINPEPRGERYASYHLFFRFRLAIAAAAWDYAPVVGIELFAGA
jgi:hypothetical protein